MNKMMAVLIKRFLSNMFACRLLILTNPLFYTIDLEGSSQLPVPFYKCGLTVGGKILEGFSRHFLVFTIGVGNRLCPAKKSAWNLY